MNEYKCPKCNSTNLFTKKKETQTGLYCKECGRWIKWLNKEEVRLFEVDVPDTNVGSKWISVEDRLPEKDGRYLVAMKNGDNYHISTRRFKRADLPTWWRGHSYGYWARHTEGVRYWMPLPELPKDGDKQ